MGLKELELGLTPWRLMTPWRLRSDPLEAPVWWAGGSFGPRYWTEAFPLFGVLLACGLDWAWDRSRGLMALCALTILLSVMVHAIGAFCFPSTWNFFPADIDVHHERLWDWRDTELSRCLKESLLGEPVPLRLPGR